MKKNSLSFDRVLTLLEKEKKNLSRPTINKHILGDGYVYNNENKGLYNKAGVLITLNNQERLLIELLLKKIKILLFHMIKYKMLFLKIGM